MVRRWALALVVVFGSVFGPGRVAAADSWVGRRQVLPSGGTNLDLGFAVDVLPKNDASERPTGTGLNLEVGHGFGNDLEFGLRFGFRFDATGRAVQTDHHARLFDNETTETAHTVLADPELRMRWNLVRGSVLELAFEGRAVLPFSGDFVLMPAFPLRLHLGAVRVDSGVYIPIVFANGTTTAVSIPVQLWIQASSALWLGPIFGFKSFDHGHEYPLGFGLGTIVSQHVDLRFQILIPNIEAHSATVAFGVALGFRL